MENLRHRAYNLFGCYDNFQMLNNRSYFYWLDGLWKNLFSQPGSTNIFTGVTADWNVARYLYSTQSCIDKARPVKFGEHPVSFANTVYTL